MKWRKGRSYFAKSKLPMNSWASLKFWKTIDWTNIKEYIQERKELGYNVYPSTWKARMRPLLELPMDKVKIVIVGQDPYYTKGVADGLPFSILPNRTCYENNGYKFKLPQALRRIFEEYRSDLGFPYPRSGDLSTWLRNGILLLNSVWTVEEGKPKSHYKIRNRMAWQSLTSEIIERLSRSTKTSKWGVYNHKKLVFIFWGSQAHELAYMVHNPENHLIIKAQHPSPLAAMHFHGNRLSFKGHKPFSKACEFLGISKNIWRLP